MKSTGFESSRTPSVRNLSDFWVRTGGFSLNFWRITPFEKLTLAERITFLIIGNRRLTGEQQGNDSDSASLQNSILQRIKAEKLASFALARLQEPTIQSAFSPLLDQGFMMGLRRIVAQEDIETEQTLARFQSLHDLLHPFGSGVIWLKGPGTAAMLYPEARMRQIGDFDLLVKESSLTGVIDSLIRAGFTIYPKESAVYGTGPFSRGADLALQPQEDWIACDSLTLRHQDGSYVEIKLDPLERGLRMNSLEQLFEQATTVVYAGREILCPSSRFQLLIACCNLRKDFFLEFRRLLDIHLAVSHLTKENFDWHPFISLCRSEGISDTVWASLAIASDRVGSAIPADVLAALRPRHLWAPLTSFTLSYRFLWNQTTLGMMLLHALWAEDARRKRTVLKRSLMPSNQFLDLYFTEEGARGNSTSWLMRTRHLIYYYLMILLPAGGIRRTMGNSLWKYSFPEKRD